MAVHVQGDVILARLMEKRERLWKDYERADDTITRTQSDYERCRRERGILHEETAAYERALADAKQWAREAYEKYLHAAKPLEKFDHELMDEERAQREPPSRLGYGVQLYIVPWARKIGSVVWPEEDSDGKQGKAE